MGITARLGTEPHQYLIAEQREASLSRVKQRLFHLSNPCSTKTVRVNARLESKQTLDRISRPNLCLSNGGQRPNHTEPSLQLGI